MGCQLSANGEVGTYVTPQVAPGPALAQEAAPLDAAGPTPPVPMAAATRPAAAAPPAVPAASEPAPPAPPPLQPPKPSASWISPGNGSTNRFYNPVETAISVESAARLEPLWRAPVGEISAPPVVVGDAVYVSTTTGLLKLDARNGAQQWQANIPGASGAFYDEATDRLFVTDSSGLMHGYDSDGRALWSAPIGAPDRPMDWSSAMVVRGLVTVRISTLMTGSAVQVGLGGFDVSTGERVWEYQHVTTSQASVWSGPSADDEGVLYGTSGNNYFVVDVCSDSVFAVGPARPETAKPMGAPEPLDPGPWTPRAHAGLPSSPPPGPPQLRWNFLAAGRALPSTGGASREPSINPMIVDIEGRKLIAAGQRSGAFYLLDRETGAQLAIQQLSEVTSSETGGILNNGAYDGKNRLFIVAANEGDRPGRTVAMEVDPAFRLRRAWQRPNSGLVLAPLSTANGVCFVPDDTTLRVLECSTGQQLNQFAMSSPIGRAPAISNGRVFVAGDLASAVPGRRLTDGGQRMLLALSLRE